jgi:hypothetical protein
MEKKPTTKNNGITLVLSSLREASNTFSSMDSEEKLRDTSRIWEIYCDIEQAIEVSKFVFNLHFQLGKIRTLRVSLKNNPATIPIEGLSKIYRDVNSNIVTATRAYEAGDAESAIEFARKARDEIKILLLAERKTRRKKKSKD